MRSRIRALLTQIVRAERRAHQHLSHPSSSRDRRGIERLHIIRRSVAMNGPTMSHPTRPHHPEFTTRAVSAIDVLLPKS
jgi:hypothetical protein